MKVVPEPSDRCTIEIGWLQRHVGGAEGHRARGDLFDAAARADRLIIQADAGLFLIGVRPFGVDRIGEGRPGAGYVDGAGADRGPVPSSPPRLLSKERRLSNAGG